MKRTRLIMMVVVAALVLMGAGYAAWTQTFTIDSTVETGELFVKVEEKSNTIEVNGEAVEDGEDYLDFATSSQTEEGKDGKTTLTTLTFNLSGMYPGVKQTSVITFTNLGTLRTVTELGTPRINSGGNALLSQLVITVDGEPVDNAGNKLENLAEAIRSAVGDLEPNESKTVTIVQELPIASGDETEGLKLTWTVPLTFQQYTAQSD